ncbi:hypothetical protein [Pseudolabrys sp. FHR47]|uniref:hypothetical protein n=1 Tax=Pseudolabrys sp. FHR47 TaxID=2562284 RepID=UPI00143D674D|nr:hypothetical protein [Pseudolabrys sp. FHR47]
MSTPAYRCLRGYSLDPGFSTRLDTAAINEVVYRIPFEQLKPGPSGEYVEVLDYDPASACWYEPVDLSDEKVASQQGLAPSEGNPQFHQQFVYAVAMKTIRHFERALGRKLIWAGHWFAGGAKRGDEYVGQLRIYPHALREANAYYDPEKRALLFGYFLAAKQYQGANYPGGLVFTCLSPDIVAHEMTHAILDSIRRRYLEDTNLDVGAFHEGFADIVALLQRFTFRELVEHQLAATSGRLDRHSVFGELATQFGEALAGNRGALRQMIGRWVNVRGKLEWRALEPSPLDYTDKTEVHERGAVLVATIFDAFQRVYKFRTADLFRIASNGTGVLPEAGISHDLVRRLAAEASKIAEHLLHICIRALDYCPPNDITFGDYLRALITADLDIAPIDENGYRLALIEAFRARGIFPDRVHTLSTESLRWWGSDLTESEAIVMSKIIHEIKPHIRRQIEAEDRQDIYNAIRKGQAELQRQLTGSRVHFTDPSKWEAFLNKLGLTSLPVSKLFQPRPDDVRFVKDGKHDENYVPPIEVHSMRAAFREAREEGRQKEQVIISLTQRVTVDIGSAGVLRPMYFRGGCQLVLDLGQENKVDFIVRMNVRSHLRFERLRRYLLGEDGSGPESESLYADDGRTGRINFNHLHSGA